MKRRILLVDDDLAVLLTLKAVLELHGFEVETAANTTEAFSRLESSIYHMVISDLRMETEEAGLEVIRAARRQSYEPATALLTAYPPNGEHWSEEQSESLLSNRWAPAICCVRSRLCSSNGQTSRERRRRSTFPAMQEGHRKAG